MLLGLTLPVFLLPGLLASEATPTTSALTIPPVLWELVGLTETDSSPAAITDPYAFGGQDLSPG